MMSISFCLLHTLHFGDKLKAGSRKMVSSAGFKYDDHDDNEEDYECLTDNEDNAGVNVMNIYPRFLNTMIMMITMKS